MSEKPLTPRQEQYLRAVAAGTPSREAALKVGYTRTYAAKIASRLKQRPAVAHAIEAIRMEGRMMAAYDLKRALVDCDQAAAFAIQHKSPMSLVKARELKAKLSGLLIEKHEVLTVSLTEALAEAKRRTARRTLPAPVVETGAKVDPSTRPRERNEWSDQVAFGE